ncbi:MAG TPA: GDSL-type esterase/lipase family protein [Parafilimonas sp.]|nr:GDSL-type esterase/lipase family protein [Parafilimonas sp.]
MKTKLFLFVVCVVFIFNATAQQPPFYDDIRAFKKQDSIKPPPQHAILFVGSSSFTKWTDVQSYFPKYTIINRGFGGSTLPDVIRYANDIIFPYQPKEVVIYCGENDFAADDNTTAQMVFDRFRTLYGMIREEMKTIQVAYVSLKPSPSRRKYWPKMIEANKMIKDYISKQSHASFINVFDVMMNASHQPKPEIFLEDSLHMNAKGYAIWKKAIEPYLIK